MGKKSPSEKTRRRGGHLARTLRICSLCVGRMPEHDTFDVCGGCKTAHVEIRVILGQIRREFPVTRRMALPEILKRLWEFRKGKIAG